MGGDGSGDWDGRPDTSPLGACLVILACFMALASAVGLLAWWSLDPSAASADWVLGL